MSYQLLDFSVKVKCTICRRDFTITVNRNDFLLWQHGELAQNAFPYLEIGDRELLISHTCSDCFDNLMRDHHA